LLISFVLFLSILSLKSSNTRAAVASVGDLIGELNEVENSGGSLPEGKTGDEYYDALRDYFEHLLPIYENSEELPFADYRRAGVKNLKEKTYGDYVEDRGKIKDYYSGFIGGISFNYPLQPDESWSRLVGKYVSGVLAGKEKIEQAFINSEVRDFYAEDALIEKLWSLVPVYCSGITKFNYDESKVSNEGDTIYHRCRRVSFQICGCPHCHFCYISADCIMEIPLAYIPAASSLEGLTYVMVMEKRKDRAAVCAQLIAEIKSMEIKSLTGRLYDYEGFVRGNL